MLDSTIKLIRAGLNTDPTLTPADCARLLLLLRNHKKQPQSQMGVGLPSIITRKQAAQRLNRSLRFVDLLARQGVLIKRILPGRKRAVGILESSLAAALATSDESG